METKIFNIDSKSRNTTKYPNSNNFKYNIVDDGTNLQIFDEKNIIELNISSIEIPNAFNFINTTKGNNVINIDSSDNIISSGSFSKNELITLLNNTEPGLVFSYSSTTGKVSIENTSGTTKTIVFISLTNGYDSLGEILGFENTTYNILNNNTLESTNVMTLPQEKYIFLKINDYGNIWNNNKKYIAKILLDNSSRYDDINQETILKLISNRIHFRKPINVNHLNISIYDYKDKLISMNGANYSLTLELKIIQNTVLKYYTENQFYDSEVIQQVLHIKMLEYYDNNTQANTKYSNTMTNNYSNNIIDYNNNLNYKK